MDELEDHWWDFECNWSPKEMLKVIIGRAPYQSDQLGATPSSRSDLPIRRPYQSDREESLAF